MGEQIIVGAGLSGLVAAINIARGGRKVRVLEKHLTVGGDPVRWPAVDVTPMVPEKLGEYIGIPLGEPQVKQLKALNAYIWGRRFKPPVEGSVVCCVERGARGEALDGYLYEVAVGEGVRFEFDHPVVGPGALSALPPDTIVATGLYPELFDTLRIPYLQTCCYGAKGHSERDSEAAIYFGPYTTDYAYWASMNGIDVIIMFKRGPISKSDLKAFAAELERTEGESADEWLFATGPTPTASFSNPRLFASDKILAGSLSGMIEPFILFGVHGALVSGKIAAMAVEDRNAAWREHRRCLYGWKRTLLFRRMYNLMPAPARRFFVTFGNRALSYLPETLGSRALNRGFRPVPGYMRVTGGRDPILYRSR